MSGGAAYRQWYSNAALARAVSGSRGPYYSQHYIYQDVFCLTMDVALLPIVWMYFIQYLRRMFDLYTPGLQFSTPASDVPHVSEEQQTLTTTQELSVGTESLSKPGVIRTLAIMLSYSVRKICITR